MAVSTVIGTTKKTYTVWHFGIKCDIMHTFMRTLKKKFISPIDLAVFFETFLPQAAVMFCETDPFFSNAATLQSRLSDSSKHRLQEKCFLLSVLQ